MNNIKLLFFILGGLLLSGCSQKIQDVNATFNEAVFGIDDVDLSAEHINSLPYASAFVTINDGPKVFMVLALAEKKPTSNALQLKWVSSDNAMIVTENGRIVKTLSLPVNNLAGLNSSSENTHFPAFSSVLMNQSSWTAVYDWMPNYRYHYQAVITPIKGEQTSVTSLLWTKNVTAIKEYVSFESLDTHFTNQYWVDNQGNTVKTVQFLGPNMTKIEMTILKPFRS